VRYDNFLLPLLTVHLALGAPDMRGNVPGILCSGLTASEAGPLPCRAS
jgi:hypothetical protein